MSDPSAGHAVASTSASTLSSSTTTKSSAKRPRTGSSPPIPTSQFERTSYRPISPDHLTTGLVPNDINSFNSTSQAPPGNGTNPLPAISTNSSMTVPISSTSTSDHATANTSKPSKEGNKPLPRGAACIACRKRKLKCDAQKPFCSNCVRLGHECAYGDPAHEKLQEKTRELEAKIMQLESELAAYKLNSASSKAQTPDPTALPTSTPASSLFPPEFDHTRLPPQASTSQQALFSPTLEAETKPFIPTSNLLNRDIGHLQSFPYTITHPHSPQLSDLMNSPLGVSQTASLHSSPHPLAVPPTPTPNLADTGLADLYAASVTTPLLDLNGQPISGTESPNGSYLPNWDTTGGMGLQRLWGAELPSLDVMLDLSDIYFSTTHIHLPFLYRPRFIYSLHNPHSLTSPPSLSLIFAVLAIAAPYHDNPTIREQSRVFYLMAREKIETSIAIGVQPTGKTIASLTVETVQALCICTMLEMGTSDHQRAFLSIGQAVRISAMLGLHRMDEDRLANMLGHTSDRRLRPPALHQLPDDPLLLEECRRTMATVLCVDRLEAACVGWPTALAEHDVRLLLPCDELIFENGRCQEGDNPLWWPEDGQDLEPGPRLGTFAWFCRAVWIGQRIQSNAYGPVGKPAGGPYHTRGVGLDDLMALQEMDAVLESFRFKLHRLAGENREKSKGFNAALIQILLVLNCNFVNAHHLLVARGLSTLPYNPNQPAPIGTAEYSMQRCIEGMGALYEILSQAAMYENLRTTLERSRITTFSSFLPYASFCIAFPAKFAIGDWSTLVASRNRTENVHARVSAILPQSDMLFGIGLDEKRLAFIDCFCDSLDRMGIVWPISKKFSEMVRGDRSRLAARVFERSSASPHSNTSNLNGASGIPTPTTF